MKISMHLKYLAVALVCAFSCNPQAAWLPANGPLTTRWTKKVSPDNALPEYPRPQLARAAWLNLNGLWDYAITDKDAPSPAKWDGEILVPFPVESALSGVMRSVTEKQRLWYPAPGMPALEEKRAVVLGEFGGLGLPVNGHSWQAGKNWGYKSFQNSTALTDAYLGLVKQLQPLAEGGLSAAVYTQR